MGADGIVLVVLIFSAVLGAIVGFGASVIWIMKRNSELWKPRVWSGVGLGIVLALVLHFSRIPGDGVLNYWPVASVWTGALGMVGGIVARFAGSAWDRRGGDRE
jgi:hypothetical protein